VTTLKLLDNISRKTDILPRLGYGLFWLALFVASLGAGRNAYAAVSCTDTITANVVVLDNPTVFNRLGAQNPNWITFALKRDVIDKTTKVPCSQTACTAGNVELRPDKRTRPLVVRSIAGSCLTVNFTNYLSPVANPNNAQQDNLFNDDQVAGRCAGFHASGTELKNGMEDDGSMVGANTGANTGNTNSGQNNCGAGLAAPGQSRIYELYTPHEGVFVVNSYGATLGSEQSSGNLGIGMFGALNVEPEGSRIYRSMVTEEELRLATTGTVPSDCTGAAGEIAGVDCNLGGQPIIDYEAKYPNVQPWISEGKAGLPILNMLTAGNELVHSDINAVIAGPCADGSFHCTFNTPAAPYPLERAGHVNPAVPNRMEAFREFTSIFHDEQTNSQVFPQWYLNPVLKHTLAGVKDQFMINYGSGGIGSEIIANRLHTGPMHDCTDCAYEEFFLSSQTVGDPAVLVNYPANTGIEQCDPSAIAGPTCWRDPLNLANGPIPGNIALFQEDPSNTHQTYTGDFVKIRNIHAGAFEQHIFHLHNNQWLFNPNDDNANYLDAQEILPGSGHTYELVNGGAGNRNKTAGDAIFHCHFYPHFAQGMWYHIRILDTFEKGSLLAVSTAAGDNFGNNDGNADGFHDQPFALRSGQPAAGARALPDGELPDGVPIPAIVPLPGKGMAPMPAGVQVVAVDRGKHSLLGGRSGPDGIPDSGQAIVDMASVAGADGVLGTKDDISPGFPFFIAGNSCGPGGATDGTLGGTVCPEGTVGQRAPTPPLDMMTEAGAAALSPSNTDPTAPNWSQLGGGWDGGLPRHNLLGYVSGGLSADTQNRLDFRKVIKMAKPVFFPETGTALEKVSMNWHSATRFRPSTANTLSAGTPDAFFQQNGSPPVPGAPYQDPCVDDFGEFLADGFETPRWHDGEWEPNEDGDDTTWNQGGHSPYSAESPRTYKIANVQIDAVFNKKGHHYSQERIIALWEDVAPTVNKIRPPEPLVMRFNSYDCGKLLHANLVPAEYELDDFQVRTPTDIIGQHIHLPKWDLTTDDGAANGWNYEDGTLSPGMVQERIEAINEFNHLAGTVVPAGTLPGQLADIDLTDQVAVATLEDADGADPGAQSVKGETELVPLNHYFFSTVEGNPQTPEYFGARTTIQRILVDPVLNVANIDRGLGLTFSHDHYGPSTFQQIGLYSTILAEPRGSTWYHNESSEQLNTRPDGGPTSWQAVIVTDNSLTPTVPDHREFYFEMSDFQHAYEMGTYVGADPNGIPMEAEVIQPDPFNATVASAPAIQDAWQQAVNPPLKLEAAGGFPDVVTAHGACPGPAGNFDPNVPRPCAEAINISHSSTWVSNYRNEPVGLRVYDPNKIGPDGLPGAQADGPGGDLALAFQSRDDRAIPQFNSKFGDTPYPTNPGYCQGNDGDFINCDRNSGDPFTPIMRAYEGDPIKVKIQVGATEEQHQSTIHGLKWTSNGSGFGRSPNSGWRNFQSHGISEQFSLQTPLNPAVQQAGQTVDYLYATDATRDGMWLGTWGILRSYGKNRTDLMPLPDSGKPGKGNQFTNNKDFDGVCPRAAPVTSFDVTAVLANEVLPNNLGVTIPSNAAPVDNVGGVLDPAGGTLVYNRRTTNVPSVTVNEPGVGPVTFTGGDGPLNDPTAMMYVLTDDLITKAEAALTPGGACYNGTKGKNAGKFNPTLAGCAEEMAAAGVSLDGCLTSGGSYDPKLATCPVVLRPDAPVEPLVLRANAGDCIDVTLRNRLVNEQAVTTSGKKVFWGGGSPAFADMADGSTPPLYDENGAPVDRADIVWDLPPDLAGWQNMMWAVTRRVQGAGTNAEVHFFNNNLIRPGSHAGIHPQLVEYDASRGDGLSVGQNQPQLAVPGGVSNARYYAGHLGYEKDSRGRWTITATPIEFGGTNLLSADRIKQPQKGLFGALVIEPQGATYGIDTMVADGQGSGSDTRPTRAQMTITAPVPAYYPAGSGGTYREGLAIGHKIANLRWADGSAIRNLHQQELGLEGGEDSGHAGFNYGMEPSWFRFELPPDVPFGNAGTPNSFGAIPNVQAFYANKLVDTQPNAIPAIAGVSSAGDPQTPVFRTTAGLASRIHVLNGASADRDGVFILHGHVWQRDPFVCPGDSYLGLPGYCNQYGKYSTDPDSIPSQALGLNPLGKYMGGEEGMGHVYGHWPILFQAGGTGAVAGDYLFRDYTPSGNRNGMFGILRAE